MDCKQEVEEGQEISRNEFASKLKAVELRDIVAVLEELRLTAEEPDLSEEQLEINKQLQEDELLALEAIYGDYLTFLTREDGESFQIKVRIEGPEEFILSVEEYSVRVAHLPPIVLTCRFPESYPSHQPPYFTISCQWLDSLRLSNLCCMLDSLWTNQPGQEIVYQWADWLQTSSLSFLGFEKEIVLDLCSLSDAGDEDSRAVSGSVSPNVDMMSMMNYNEDRRHAIFLEDLHQCCICFSERAGTDFMILPCKHFFCRKCMETYSRIHVKEGTVNKLVCPDAKCGGMIPPGLLKRLLEKEQFERWESILLKKTLASMSDIFYCPRCETTSIKESDNQSQCPLCFFSFCSICQQKLHEGTPCVIPETELESLKERQGSSQTMDRKKRKELAMINEVLSMNEIEKVARQCPTCRIWIARTEGCNHMECKYCGTSFCFLCFKIIGGYKHYRDNECPLFPNEKKPKQSNKVRRR